jgi:hypothetical protein
VTDPDPQETTLTVARICRTGFLNRMDDSSGGGTAGPTTAAVGDLLRRAGLTATAQQAP